MDHDPVLVEQAARVCLEHFNPPDDKHATWWIRPDEMARAVLDAVAPTLMVAGARQVAEAVLDAAPPVNSELRHNGVPDPGMSIYVEGFKDAHDAAREAVARIEGGA